MIEPETFRVTFGQKYAREPHPRFSLAHPDRVVEIVATDYDDARAFTVMLFGSTWCDLYSPTGWELSAQHFEPEPSCRLVTPAAAEALREFWTAAAGHLYGVMLADLIAHGPRRFTGAGSMLDQLDRFEPEDQAAEGPPS